MGHASREHPEGAPPRPPSWTRAGTARAGAPLIAHGPWACPRRIIMRGILLWAVGIPIPVIILLYLFNVL